MARQRSPRATISRSRIERFEDRRFRVANAPMTALEPAIGEMGAASQQTGADERSDEPSSSLAAADTVTITLFLQW
jgi:hypothetical protein